MKSGPGGIIGKARERFESSALIPDFCWFPREKGVSKLEMESQCVVLYSILHPTKIDKEKEMIFFACHHRTYWKMLFAKIFWMQLIVLLFSHFQPVFADSFFVATAGSGTSCSQAAPCTLETAMNQAAGGDTIYVAQGAYTDSGAADAVISITQGIDLYGGWNGASSGAIVRDAAMYPTILDGQNARRVVFISGTVPVTLDGFIVANGKLPSGNGAGLYAQNADLTLNTMSFNSNVIDGGDEAFGGGAYVESGSICANACTFKANSAWASQSSQGGGLAIFNTSTASVENSIFEDNDAWIASGLYFFNDNSGYAPFILRTSTFNQNGRGRSSGVAFGGYSGAIKVSKADACLEGNVFTENRASNDHGAVSIFTSEFLFTRNIISGNECARISGLYILYSWDFTVSNNIISDNQSTNNELQMPAVILLGGAGQFLHNTIARNTGEYGIQLAMNTNVTLTNNILAGHTVGITVDDECTASMEATLWGSEAWANGTDWGGLGTIDFGTINRWGDPGFVDPDNGDYHIGPGSAARNAGIDAGVNSDIDEDLRPIGPGFDIGADENNTVAITPVIFLLLEN
ncbi:MAG: hypothetical protein GY864_04425 [Desulfobacterales bacterium]|nr:hypothetical protein [Desulfobacterales bacterium]